MIFLSIGLFSAFSKTSELLAPLHLMGYFMAWKMKIQVDNLEKNLCLRLNFEPNESLCLNLHLENWQKKSWSFQSWDCKSSLIDLSLICEYYIWWSVEIVSTLHTTIHFTIHCISWRKVLGAIKKCLKQAGAELGHTQVKLQLVLWRLCLTNLGL